MAAVSKLAYVLVATFVVGVSAFVAASAFQGGAVAGIAGVMLVACQSAMLYFTYVRVTGLQNGTIGAEESSRLLRKALSWGGAAVVLLLLLAAVMALSEH